MYELLLLPKSLLSLDHATSLIPNLCPEIVFSNLPSYAPQILINLSAAATTKMNNTRQLTVQSRYLQELASHSPLGLNFTEETAFVWPANVNFSV